MPKTRDSALMQQFADYLRSQGLSVTSQREAVVREVARIGPHFDAEELAGRLRRRRPPVSRATVYRTVHHLEVSGVVRKVDLDESHAHYETTVGATHHEHLICTRCGRIVEVTDRALEQRFNTLARRHGFELDRHAVRLLGLCRKCRQ